MIIYQTHPTPSPTAWDTLTVSEMAATMQDMDAAGDPVTPDNLRLRGYSSEDITHYGLKAANLARKLTIKAAS